MPVIINELEIVHAPAPKADAAPPPQPTPPLLAEDIERVVERQRQRLRRLMAN
jgi:hypothetical protein